MPTATKRAEYERRYPIYRMADGTALIQAWELLPGERLIGHPDDDPDNPVVYARIVRIHKATDDDHETWKRLLPKTTTYRFATVATLDNGRKQPYGVRDLVRVALPRPDRNGGST